MDQGQMEKRFRANDGLISFLYKTAKKMGKNISIEGVIKNAVETWGDPTGERLISSMDESGIDVSVILNVDDLTQTMQEKNMLIGEIVRKYPKRIIGFAGVDPRRSDGPDMLKQCFEEFGLKGLKYHPDNGFDPAGPQSYKLLEVLSEYKGILLSHTGPLWPPTRAKFAESMLLADIGVDFPDLKVIAAHMGYINWRPWASLAAHQPNLYGDLAMWDILAFNHYDLFCRELRDLIDFVGVEKVLFGTDHPCFSILEPVKNWIQLIKDLPINSPDKISFSREEANAVLGDNAAKVLGL
jgi:predicted TIM-barrel fold metal-dependent hydrolase